MFLIFDHEDEEYVDSTADLDTAIEIATERSKLVAEGANDIASIEIYKLVGSVTSEVIQEVTSEYVEEPNDTETKQEQPKSLSDTSESDIPELAPEGDQV